LVATPVSADIAAATGAAETAPLPSETRRDLDRASRAALAERPAALGALRDVVSAAVRALRDREAPVDQAAATIKRAVTDAVTPKTSTTEAFSEVLRERRHLLIDRIWRWSIGAYYGEV
jgi:hypothetical protein